MIILDGKEYSKKLKNEIKEEAIRLTNKTNIVPCIAIVLVGEDPASQVYVRNKVKAANLCKMNPILIKKEATITQKELLELVDKLNNDDAVHGIIVQLPLPKHLNEQEVINKISDKKDVDGFGLLNKGKLFSGLTSIESATPKGIIKLLDEYKIEITGKNAVVVGRSNIVGKPMAILLLNRNATVTVCHSRTQNLKEITKNADILVVAIGKANFIKEDMVKEGAVIIDVGTNRVDDKLVGDVDFENVSPKCSYITPVPGGVGPLTIASLLENTIIAYKNILNVE